ncbi:MAG: hypothetical protein P6D49_02270 [Acidimicrobiales bacterium]|nr:hypothetical protein [Acidimicrobiales bacterium]
MMRRTRPPSTPARLSALALAGLLLVGCANSGVPEGWDDQPDEIGRGLAERNFIDACMEANDDLSESRASSLCECVLDEVQGSASYDDYERLDDHFKDKGDEATESGLRDLFAWFTDAVDACNT